MCIIIIYISTTSLNFEYIYEVSISFYGNKIIKNDKKLLKIIKNFSFIFNSYRKSSWDIDYTNNVSVSGH